MDNLIIHIGEPVFVGTAGPNGQVLDHVDVQVQLNKEMSNEELRPAFRASLGSIIDEIQEKICHDEQFLRYGVPVKRLEFYSLVEAPALRLQTYSFRIGEMKINKMKFVYFDPAGAKVRALIPSSRRRVIPPDPDLLIDPLSPDMCIAKEIRDGVAEELESVSLQTKDPYWERKRDDQYYRVIDLCDPDIDWDAPALDKKYERMKYDTICVLGVQCCNGRIPKTAVERLMNVRGRYTSTIVCLIIGDSGRKPPKKLDDAAYSRKYQDAILELVRTVEKNGLLTIAACAVDTKQKIMFEYGKEQPARANKAHYRQFGKRVVRRIWEEIEVPQIN